MLDISTSHQLMACYNNNDVGEGIDHKNCHTKSSEMSEQYEMLT